MASFSLGDSERERIVVTVHGYERAVTGEYYDDNWISVEVGVSAGAFSGRFAAAFLIEDFVRFRAALQLLFDSLKGEAIFSALEKQLFLRVVGNDRGGVEVTGIAVDRPGDGNKIEFHLFLDQTYLGATLKELNDLVSSFLVRHA